MIRPQSSPTRSPAADARSASERRAAERLVAPPDREQDVDEVDLESDVELGRRNERRGPLEQAQRGAEVVSRERPLPGGGQAALRRRRQRAVVGSPSSAR